MTPIENLIIEQFFAHNYIDCHFHQYEAAQYYLMFNTPNLDVAENVVDMLDRGVNVLFEQLFHQRMQEKLISIYRAVNRFRAMYGERVEQRDEDVVNEDGYQADESDAGSSFVTAPEELSDFDFLEDAELYDSELFDFAQLMAWTDGLESSFTRDNISDIETLVNSEDGSENQDQRDHHHNQFLAEIQDHDVQEYFFDAGIENHNNNLSGAFYRDFEERAPAGLQTDMNDLFVVGDYESGSDVYDLDGYMEDDLPNRVSNDEEAPNPCTASSSMPDGSGQAQHEIPTNHQCVFNTDITVHPVQIQEIAPISNGVFNLMFGDGLHNPIPNNHGLPLTPFDPTDPANFQYFSREHEDYLDDERYPLYNHEGMTYNTPHPGSAFEDYLDNMTLYELPAPLSEEERLLIHDVIDECFQTMAERGAQASQHVHFIEDQLHHDAPLSHDGMRHHELHYGDYWPGYVQAEDEFLEDSESEEEFSASLGLTQPAQEPPRQDDDVSEDDAESVPQYSYGREMQDVMTPSEEEDEGWYGRDLFMPR